MNKKLFCILFLVLVCFPFNTFAITILESYCESEGLSPAQLEDLFFLEAIDFSRYRHKAIYTKLYDNSAEQNYYWGFDIYDVSYYKNGKVNDGRRLILSIDNGVIVVWEFTSPRSFQWDGYSHQTTDSYYDFVRNAQAQILPFMKKSQALLKKYGKKQSLESLAGFIAMTTDWGNL